VHTDREWEITVAYPFSGRTTDHVVRFEGCGHEVYAMCAIDALGIAPMFDEAIEIAWFRQSWDEIQRQRDGITVDAAGLSDLTAALAKLLPAHSRTATDEAWLDATRDREARTAAAYGILAVHDATDNRQRLEGGRLLERIHLWVTGHGLALQHMNQLTERADRELELAIKPQFGDALGELVPTGWQALPSVRIGHPTHTPHKSPRRPSEAVILVDIISQPEGASFLSRMHDPRADRCGHVANDDGGEDEME